MKTILLFVFTCLVGGGFIDCYGQQQRLGSDSMRIIDASLLLNVGDWTHITERRLLIAGVELAVLNEFLGVQVLAGPAIRERDLRQVANYFWGYHIQGRIQVRLLRNSTFKCYAYYSPQRIRASFTTPVYEEVPGQGYLQAVDTDVRFRENNHFIGLLSKFEIDQRWFFEVALGLGQQKNRADAPRSLYEAEEEWETAFIRPREFGEWHRSLGVEWKVNIGFRIFD